MIIASQVNAQPSFEEFTTDWSIAGLERNPTRDLKEKYPVIANYSFVQDFDFVEDLGGDNSGDKDNSDLLNQFLKDYPGSVKIIFPAGIYLFNKSIDLRSDVILEGYNPGFTIFQFNLDKGYNNLFNLVGEQESDYYKVTRTFVKGDNKMILSSSSGLEIGNDIDLEQKNGDFMFFYMSHDQPWAEWSVGQMLKIANIRGDTITFDRSLTHLYNTSLEPRLSKINMIRNVHLEKFTIIRTDKQLGSNFFLYHAANVSINCIISKYASLSHVRIERSRNIEVQGNVFYDAIFHCGGGAGYGVLIKKHSTECLVTNNIFENLRHAMILKEGANRNVISYNFSSHVIISDGSVNEENCRNERIATFPDISIHGHYSFLNLFEGNVVQAIHSADNWGPTGPGTTFLRNKIETDYGIKIWMGSEEHILIGNVIPSGIIETDAYTYKVFKINNNERNYINMNLDYKIMNSMYLKEAPSFYHEMIWPSIDPVKPEFSTNPAKKRRMNNKLLDETLCGDVHGLTSIITNYDGLLVFYDKGYLYTTGMEDLIFNLQIYDVQGKGLVNFQNINNLDSIFIGYLADGIYIADYLGDGFNYRIKFIVQN